MSSTYTSSSTYTFADIETVLTSFRTDLLMIADCTGALTADKARRYASDIETLVKHGYLQSVDVTLLDYWNNELRATQYTVDTVSGSLTNRRPGGVRWPFTPNGSVRIVFCHTAAYNAEAAESIRRQLEYSWGPANTDISHSSLRSSGGRDYASNGFGLQRKDFVQ